MKSLFGWLALACLVVACGAGEGPKLGAFPAISKQETDAPFDLVAPSSRSPASFYFMIDNAAVATVDGAHVTIKGPGTATVTAGQNAIGGYGPTRTTTTLTVTAVACAAGSTRVNGTCTPLAACTAPATRVGNDCVAPATTATQATTGNLIYAGVTLTDNFEHASAYCTTTVIDGVANWRLPTQAELTALVQSGAIAGHNWVLGNTWTSTMGSSGAASSHVAVNLATGEVAERADGIGAYVSCVH